MPTKRHRQRWAADGVLVIMFGLTAVLYALLMLQDRVPQQWLVVLAGFGLLHWALAGWRRPTPLDIPILGLLALLPLSLSVTIARNMTLTKVFGVLLGAALFYITAHFISSRARLHLALVGLLVLSLGVAGVGLVGTDWTSTKVIDLPRIYAALPRLMTNVPRSREGGIQANLVGGALAFLVPFLFSLLWDRGGFNLARVWRWHRGARLLKFGYKAIVVVALAAVSVTLLLTQSRGGLLGALAGVLAVLIWYERRLLWALPVLVVNGLLAAHLWGAESLLAFFNVIDALDGETLPIRGDFWARGLRLVQDFPLTGSGIGTYTPLVRLFYPFPSALSERVTSSEVLFNHAHNQVLVVATDLGLPGLVLYAALLGGFAAIVVRAWPYAGRLVRAVLIGLSCGLLAHQVFGIMDAFMLGSKLGALLWIFLGLGAALYVHRDKIRGPRPVPMRVSRGFWAQLVAWLVVLFQGAAGWLGVSVVAVAFVHINTIFSLGLAVVGGSALGVLLVQGYEDTFIQPPKGKTVELTEARASEAQLDTGD